MNASNWWRLLVAGMIGGIAGVLIGFALARSMPGESGLAQKPPSSASPVVVQNSSPEKTIPVSQSTVPPKTNQRTKGTYILDLDNPSLRTKLDEATERAVAALMQKRGPEYEALFSKLGIPENQWPQILHHIALIHVAKLESHRHLAQLMNAQAEYEKSMKVSLGEKFPEYLNYERSQKARDEIEQIDKFVKDSGLSAIAPERRNDLQQIIETSGAYSASTLSNSTGAFDEFGKPLRGNAVLPSYEQEQAKLSMAMTTALAKARESGFSETEIRLLQQYYSTEIQRYESRIHDILDPVSAQRRMLEKQLVRTRQNPNASSEQIQMLERMLRKVNSGAVVVKP